uniref:Uncharacterized protein n=1 Tax=Eutreptiella gymnastica TaxID=73025 RepID=A0A7S4G7N7_9EUGL
MTSPMLHPSLSILCIDMCTSQMQEFEQKPQQALKQWSSVVCSGDAVYRCGQTAPCNAVCWRPINTMCMCVKRQVTFMCFWAYHKSASAFGALDSAGHATNR